MARISITAWKSEPVLSINMKPKDIILEPMKADKVSHDQEESNLIISSEKEKPSATFDDFFAIVGDRGPWQLTIWVIFFVLSFFSSWHNLVMTFLAPSQKFWCISPQDTVSVWANTSPLSTDSFQGNPCYFVNGSLDKQMGQQDVPCSKWDYEKSIYKSTLIGEWNLVCRREWLIPAAKSIYMIGSIIAVPLAGLLMNRLGRRITVFISCGIFLLTSVASLFSPSMLVFLVLRFFLSLGLTSVYLVIYISMMTSVGFKSRSDYYIICHFGWAIGYTVLPAVAWLMNEWFYIQLAITLPCIVILLPVLGLLPENHRWLVDRSKMIQAIDLLKNAAKKNGNLATDFIEIYLQSLKNEPEEKKSFDTKIPRVLILYFCWFSTSFFYYGLSWNTDFLRGNPYANFALSGSAEVPAILFLLFASIFIRRRVLLAGSSIAAGSFLIMVAILCKDPMRIPILLFLTAKFFITSSSILLNLYSFEISSFSKGNVNLHACFVASSFGAAVSPFVAVLNRQRSMPFLTFGGCCLLSGFLTFCLPDDNKTDTKRDSGEAKEGKKMHV